MRSARIPGDVLAAEIRAGNITVGGLGGTATLGVAGHVASRMAASGLEKAGQVGQQEQGLRFPPHCCNCLATGSRVRSIESVSIVNRVVPYTFKFRIPHCSRCADTANRKRPGTMGMVAAFLAISVPIIIVVLGFGAAANSDALMAASLIIGPVAGIALPHFWTKMRRPGPGQASRYQAVYASAVDVDFSGVPKSFTLAFENDGYAGHFIALNRELAVKSG